METAHDLSSLGRPVDWASACQDWIRNPHFETGQALGLKTHDLFSRFTGSKAIWGIFTKKGEMPTTPFKQFKRFNFPQQAGQFSSSFMELNIVSEPFTLAQYEKYPLVLNQNLYLTTQQSTGHTAFFQIQQHYDPNDHALLAWCYQSAFHYTVTPHLQHENHWVYCADWQLPELPSGHLAVHDWHTYPKPLRALNDTPRQNRPAELSEPEEGYVDLIEQLIHETQGPEKQQPSLTTQHRHCYLRLPGIHHSDDTIASHPLPAFLVHHQAPIETIAELTEQNCFLDHELAQYLNDWELGQTRINTAAQALQARW